MNPVAVVTGGARRIGLEIARTLHDRGFHIALHYRHSGDAAGDLAEQLLALRPDSCRLFQADLECVGQVAAMAAEIVARYPAVDLLVNNASGFEPTPLEGCTPAQFDRMIASNLRGPYFLVQGLLPALRSKGGGSIINIVDVHVRRPLPGYSAYVAAKAGLEALTRSLAVELAPAIRVNAVAPGAILWPDGGEAYDAAARADTIAATPLARVGEPADIARTVAFLACEAPFITGQVITVDGGRSLT